MADQALLNRTQAASYLHVWVSAIYRAVQHGTLVPDGYEIPEKRQHPLFAEATLAAYRLQADASRKTGGRAGVNGKTAVAVNPEPVATGASGATGTEYLPYTACILDIWNGVEDEARYIVRTSEPDTYGDYLNFDVAVAAARRAGCRLQDSTPDEWLRAHPLARNAEMNIEIRAGGQADG